MKVKICGITDLENGLYAAKSGADALGFVFAESRRRIAPEEAAEIIAKLPGGPLKIGVFVNESKEIIEKTAEIAGLDMVQLHGDETPEFCAGINLPVIKALSVQGEEDLARIAEYPCDYILLDSPKGKYRGGNGIAFDWSILEGRDFGGKKVILAGGLNPENAREAIRKASPFMADVSSGVEKDGKKDPALIAEFIAEAKNALKNEEELK